MHYVVVKKKEAADYKGGLGYQGPELKELQFPVAPYGRAGARILINQIKKINPKLELVIVPFIGDYW